MQIVGRSIKAGVVLFMCISAWYFITKLFGWEEIAELRFLNVIFAVIITNWVAKSNVLADQEIGYLRNFQMLMTTNIVAVILSIFGLNIYLTLISPSSLEIIEDSMFWGTDLNLIEISFGLLLEGLAGGLIISFATMQYWKDRGNKAHHHKNETDPSFDKDSRIDNKNVYNPPIDETRVDTTTNTDIDTAENDKF